MIRTHNDTLFDTLSPYVVATTPNLDVVEMAPFGLRTRWHVDPQRLVSAPFLTLLQRLDALTFGPEGMPMAKWVFYNCAELPGFIYGFGVPAADLSAAERELMSVPEDYAGPVPFSMYIAIPMHEPGAWFGHNLASLNRTFPSRNLRYLGTVTKAIALKAFGAETFFGATQWKSKALFIHTKFGPLDLHTAYTPAHSLPETLTYGFKVTDEALRFAAGDPAVTLDYPAPTEELDADDADAMLALQREIEAGARFQLVGGASIRGPQTTYPIRRVTAPSSGS